MYSFAAPIIKKFKDTINEARSQEYKGPWSDTLELQGSLSAHQIARNFRESNGLRPSVIRDIFKNKFRELWDGVETPRAEHPLFIYETKCMSLLQQDFIELGELTDTQVSPIHKAYASMGIKDDYRDISIAQILATVITSRMGVVGKNFYLPIKIDGKYTLREYKIDKFFIGKKLPVISLCSPSDDAPSWILFRGMSTFFGIREGAFESLKTCLFSEKGLDIAPVDESLDVFRDKIAELKSSSSGAPKELYVAGHSYGAVCASALRLAFPDKINKMFGFASPGACKKLASRYERSTKDSLHMEIFNAVNDIVPSVGRFVIGNVHSVSIKSHAQIFDYHLSLFMLHPHTISLVDNKADSEKSGRLIIEGARSMPARFIKTAAHFITPAVSRIRNAWKRIMSRPARLDIGF